MARKSFMYSVLEAVQYEMRQDKNMIWIFELTPPVASNPGKPVINLETEFGRLRVANTGIDENWMAGCVLGAGLAGSKALTYIPYQGACMPFQMIQNHAGKLRSMTGGDASMPVVFIMAMTGQTAGFAGQHSDYEIDTYYAHIPGVKTVIPSNPVDAKGMMVSAIRDPNPVVFLYAAGLRELVEEVPDEQYLTPLDKAAVRTTGSDITIVSSGAGMPDVLDATEKLQKAGMKVEAIGPAQPEADRHRDLGQVGAKSKAAADLRSIVLHALPRRRGHCPGGGERRWRQVQTYRFSGCAAAGCPGNVQLDAAQCRSHHRCRKEVLSLSGFVRPAIGRSAASTRRLCINKG
jgi:acetoin:2,6-dichlorophenolindophenol oxidoreductase subunit beta